VLGVHGGVIVRRVQAMQAPPPAAMRWPAPLLAGVAGGALVLEAAATADFFAVLQAWLIA
jgi:hypothetical protein